MGKYTRGMMRQRVISGRAGWRRVGRAALLGAILCVCMGGCNKAAHGPSVAVGAVATSVPATAAASATPTVTPSPRATATSSPTASPIATATTAPSITVDEAGGLALALTTAAFTSATADEVVRMVADGQPDARQKAFALAVYLAKFGEELGGAGDVMYAGEVLENLRGVGATMGGWMSGEIGEDDLPDAMAPWQAASDQTVGGLVDEMVAQGVLRADVDAFVAEVMGAVLPGTTAE